MAQYVTIRVKDPAGLVKAQGGAAGDLVYRLAPQATENLIYGRMRSEIAKSMKDKGVDAEVTVTASPPVETSGRDLVTGIALGAAGAGALYGVGKLIGHLMRRR